MNPRIKIPVFVLIAAFILSLSSAQLEFRTQNPIDFRSNLDLNNNTISNLPDPVTGDQAAPESYISSNFLRRVNPTVQGDLALSSSGNLELRGGYISNDGDGEGIRILDNGNIRIRNGVLNVSGNSLTGLPASDDSNDAVRQDQLSNYVKLDGDTLDGNLSFNNQYYVTNLPQPENPSDAATKSFVESYSDTNDNVISDDQDLSVSTEASNGGQTTIDITNGSSATFTDDYAADDQALSIDSSSTDDVITLDDGGQVTIDDDNTQVDDTGASSNVDMNGYDITSTGGEVCAGEHC